MTAQIIAFPEPDRRPFVVACARQILRNAENHTDESIDAAVAALLEWGDAADRADARLAIHRPRPVPVSRPPYSPGVRFIRAALVDCAGLAVIVAVATAVYHMGVS